MQMNFSTLDWELGDIEINELPELSDGEHILYIEKAMYLPDDIDKDTEQAKTRRFTLILRSISKDERSTMNFNLTKNGVDNPKIYGTLNSLKHALRGPDSGKGILAPPNMEKGVVKATVKCKPWEANNGEVRIYPNIYHFDPVTIDEYELASAVVETVAQYVKE